MPLSVSIVGQGRPIVLLPGFALDGAVMKAAFEPVFAGLEKATGTGSTEGRAGGEGRGETKSAAGWQRIYVDLPGTGGSPAVEPTSEAVVDEIRETVAALIGGTPYRLVGHSYGGYLATGLARRDAGQVVGLFLWCCGLRIRPGDRDLTGVRPSSPEPGWLEGVPEELHEHFEHAIGHQTRACADRVAAALARRGPLDDAYLAALRPDGYQLADEPKEDGLEEDEPEEDGLGEDGLEEDEPKEDDQNGRDGGKRGRKGEPKERHRGTPFTGPVSILAGHRDRVAGYRDPVAALRYYPNASVTVLAQAGHYLPFEQPETLVTHARAWLASVE